MQHRAMVARVALSLSAIGVSGEWPALHDAASFALRGRRHHLRRHIAWEPIRNRTYGDTRCPCIGFDNIEGETVVTLDGGTQVAYPADLGARCDAWDDGRHSSCKEGAIPGIGEGWCRQRWCYVDSCNCNLPVLPKASAYMPDARFRGRPLFFSYATCGSEDEWSKELPEIGTTGCRCIGFHNVPGTIKVTLRLADGDNRSVAYPEEVGGSCKAWDQELHPDCQRGKDSPAWCDQRWCYVDPCSCNLAVPPKATTYLPEATFQGKSLYYSYETCGAVDHFTATHNFEACVDQMTEESCLKLKVRQGGTRCAWTGTTCLGWEIFHHPTCKHVVQAAQQVVQEADSHRNAAPGVYRHFALSLAVASSMAAHALPG